MNAYPPTHDHVARRAYEYWQQQGSPDGRDQEMWFEAERQLATEATALKSSLPEWQSDHPKREEAATPAPTAPSHDAVHPMAPSKEVTQQQKKEARLPQLPAKTAPKAMPPESGKPLWDRPHSR